MCRFENTAIFASCSFLLVFSDLWIFAQIFLCPYDSKTFWKFNQFRIAYGFRGSMANMEIFSTLYIWADSIVFLGKMLIVWETLFYCLINHNILIIQKMLCCLSNQQKKPFSSILQIENLLKEIYKGYSKIKVTDSNAK